jgi:hypothetical protein
MTNIAKLAMYTVESDGRSLDFIGKSNTIISFNLVFTGSRNLSGSVMRNGSKSSTSFLKEIGIKRPR